MGPNLQFLAEMDTFTKEILNGKLHFLGSVSSRLCDKVVLCQF